MAVDRKAHGMHHVLATVRFRISSRQVRRCTRSDRNQPDGNNAAMLSCKARYRWRYRWSVLHAVDGVWDRKLLHRFVVSLLALRSERASGAKLGLIV
jgi:hypothetical protein